MASWMYNTRSAAMLTANSTAGRALEASAIASHARAISSSPSGDMCILRLWVVPPRAILWSSKSLSREPQTRQEGVSRMSKN
jgi:hypothetical protein